MNIDLPADVDVLVIGGGPAGLSAATWLGRYQRSTLVVDAGNQRNLPAQYAHGLLGRDPTTARELLDDACAGLEQYPQVLLRQGTVTGIRRDEDGLFHAVIEGVDTAEPTEATQVTAQRIVLASGVRDRFPKVVGFHDHYGRDVYHCLACDGLTARDQTVIVLGSGEHVPAYAAELLEWADKVRIIAENADSFTERQRETLATHGIEVVNGPAEAFIGEPGALEGVRLASGEVIEGSKVFFSYAHYPANDLARQLGCDLDHEGQPVINGYQLTSVEGVYAAGDIVAGWQLIPIALGTGTAAGLACATSLRGHATAAMAPDPAPPTGLFKAHERA